MLRLANIQKGEVLYDLGSGDGRIPIAAAKQFGIRAVGIEIDPKLVTEAEANALRAGVFNWCVSAMRTCFASTLARQML